MFKADLHVSREGGSEVWYYEQHLTTSFSILGYLSAAPQNSENVCEMSVMLLQPRGAWTLTIVCLPSCQSPLAQQDYICRLYPQNIMIYVVKTLNMTFLFPEPLLKVVHFFFDCFLSIFILPLAN